MAHNENSYNTIEIFLLTCIAVFCLGCSYFVYRILDVERATPQTQIFSLSTHEAPMTTTAVDTKIVTENFKRWNDALLSKDPKKVAELYTADATFLPTLSPKYMYGNKEAEGYFEHFLKKNPSGKVVASKVQILSPTSYLHSGLYNFSVDVDKDRTIVEARFTFLWVKDGKDGWKIAHHHSSVKPK